MRKAVSERIYLKAKRMFASSTVLVQLLRCLIFGMPSISKRPPPISCGVLRMREDSVFSPVGKLMVVEPTVRWHP